MGVVDRPPGLGGAGAAEAPPRARLYLARHLFTLLQLKTTNEHQDYLSGRLSVVYSPLELRLNTTSLGCEDSTSTPSPSIPPSAPTVSGENP